jgi:hypothetical protein
VCTPTQRAQWRDSTGLGEERGDAVPAEAAQLVNGQALLLRLNRP